MKLEDMCISNIMRYNIQTSPEMIPRKVYEKLQRVVTVNGKFEPCQPTGLKIISIIHNSEGIYIRFICKFGRSQELYIPYGSQSEGSFDFDVLLNIPLRGKVEYKIKYSVKKSVIYLSSEDEIRKCCLMLEM